MAVASAMRPAHAVGCAAVRAAAGVESCQRAAGAGCPHLPPLHAPPTFLPAAAALPPHPQVTDPYLKLFSGLVPPLLGSIDLTPLFGFFILQFLAGEANIQLCCLYVV